VSKTILFEDRQSTVTDASLENDALWIGERDLEAATGWHLEARGACRGAQCIPLPPAANWSQGGRFNLSAFASHRGQGAAQDGAREICSFGPPASHPYEDGFAPDFELPDFSGRTHTLSQYRGKKVLLVTWASW
jgi:hypothetical protein